MSYNEGIRTKIKMTRQHVVQNHDAKLDENQVLKINMWMDRQTRSPLRTMYVPFTRSVQMKTYKAHFCVHLLHYLKYAVRPSGW